MDLGVNRPCFGEYHCKICNRKWASAKAWKFFGQKCTTCDTTIQATNLRELFRYYCRDCKKLWKYKWVEDGIACNDCGEKVKAFRTHAEFRNAEAEYILPDRLSLGILDTPIDQDKSHRSDLCERCNKMGVNCSNGAPLVKPLGSHPQANVSNPASVASQVRLVGQTETMRKVRNWSDFPPPPPPPAVNPWNRFTPSSKPQPQAKPQWQPVPSLSSRASRLPEPTPSLSILKSPERKYEPEQPKRLTAAASNRSPVQNGTLPNGIHRPGTYEISPPKFKSNGSMSKLNGGVGNGSTPKQRANTIGNGTAGYSSYRQNQTTYADENSWSLWNCTIQ